MLFQLDKPWEWLQIAIVIVMKIAIERVFRVLPPMRVHVVVYFIPGIVFVILLYYGTRTTVQWNGITAVYRKTVPEDKTDYQLFTATCSNSTIVLCTGKPRPPNTGNR